MAGATGSVSQSRIPVSHDFPYMSVQMFMTVYEIVKGCATGQKIMDIRNVLSGRGFLGCEMASPIL